MRLFISKEKNANLIVISILEGYIHIYYIQLALRIFLCTKCHVRDVGFLLIVKLLLFTKIYHHFKFTRSFSLSSNVHAQNFGAQKFLEKKVLRRF